MKKQTVFLLILLPIVIVLILVSAVSLISVAAEIPVSGIRFSNVPDSGVVALDLASSFTFDMQVEVLPSRAKNKNYTYSVENITGDCGGCVTGDTFTAQDVGQTKVTVRSSDGGYKASFVAVVSSSKALDFTPVISDADGDALALKQTAAGFEAKIGGGIYFFGADVKPNGFLKNGIEWTCADDDILSVNGVTGSAVAKLSGDTSVTARLDDGAGGVIEKTIGVRVDVKENASGLSVNGGVSVIKAVKGTERIAFSVDKKTAGELYLEMSDAFRLEEIRRVDNADDGYVVTLALNGAEADAFEIVLGAKNGGGNRYLLKVEFYDYDFEVLTAYHDRSGEIIYQLENTDVNFIAVENAALDGVDFEWSSSSEGLEILLGRGERCVARALERGDYSLVVTARRNGAEICCRTVKVKVVARPDAYSFKENNSARGIADEWIVGGSRTDGKTYFDDELKLSLAETAHGVTSACSGGDVELICKGAEAVFADGGVVVRNAEAGVVSLTAKWKYGDYFKTPVSAEISYYCEPDAVNIYAYDELKKATADGKEIALQNDIMLGRKGMTLEQMKAEAVLVPTTYDFRYYLNQKLARPSVYALVEFKGDVYGNGCELNAEYFTMAKDKRGEPLFFKTPLDFVSMGTAAVKGQDNISFLARTDGINIDNVVLKGCGDEAITQDGALNLKLLDCAGTVLEIGANTKLTNSRISNGRTAVRVFGGGDKGLSEDAAGGNPVVADPASVDAQSERVCALIERCVLSCAREFILKLGSNRALEAAGHSKETFRALPLTAADGTAYSADEDNTDDDYFVSRYLTTEVTLCDSVLTNSGLFSIGIDAHFSGEMLNGYHFLAPMYWQKLAATSFASILRLKGDVRLYDWKKLDMVDSSTLIETVNGADAYLKLDIPAMIEKVNRIGGDGYKNVFALIGAEKYVHGGIACFGGGVNYSVVDLTEFSGERFDEYSINLSILAKNESKLSLLYLQGTLLPSAAGYEDFKFYIYGAQSKNGYAKQRADLLDGSAYAPVFKSGASHSENV